MPGSLAGRRTAPGSNQPAASKEPKKEEFDPYNVSRVGWEPFNVVNNAFPGVPKKKVEAPREPVKNFNFNIDPKHLELDLYHQSQLNWLNDQVMALIMKEERSRDFVDQSCGDLKGSIDELDKWLQKIDKEGNEWKSRFENQQEHNNVTGLEILRLTDAIENIRNQINNNEPPLKKFDEFTDAKWKKMLKQQEKTFAKLAEDLQEIEWRLEEEAKAYFKINRMRNEYNQELNILNHYEAKELHNINQEQNKKQDNWRQTRENPPRRREILEEFGRRPKKATDESEFDTKSVASTRFTRSRGRFTARDSGLGSASRSTTRRNNDSDGYSDRGDSLDRSSVGGGVTRSDRVVGSRVPITRKTEDPVDALFASSRNGLPAGYGYQQRRTAKSGPGMSVDSGFSRANTRKSALKTDRSSNSRFSERNKVSFADSRRVSASMDVQSIRSQRQLPPLDLTSGNRSSASSVVGSKSVQSMGNSRPQKMPNTNGVVLNPNQQNEINKLLQKPAKWRDH